MNKTTSSGEKKIVSNRNFLNNDTAEQIDRYLDEICSNPDFLCKNKENKELCGKNTSIYSNVANVDKICTDLKKANQCEDDVKECVVTTPNLLDDARGLITTSFSNIIIPIPDATDELGNQKFLRLPALSGSKKPNSQDICNLCACMNRFATAPGSLTNIGEASYTAPGQNICIYPTFVEHYYYPLSIENINSKLKDVPPITLGKYRILNKNIIFAQSEEQLLVPNLYDLLMKHSIPEIVTKKFILNTLFKNNRDKSKELQNYLDLKKQINIKQINKGFFYENITFFYILLVLFIFLLLINLF
jgi:hypothetical protein